MDLKALTGAEREQIRERVEEAYRKLGKRGWENYAPFYMVGYQNDGGRAVEIEASVHHSTDDETLLLIMGAAYPDSLRWTWTWDGNQVMGDPFRTEKYGRGSVVVPLSGPDEVPTPREAMRFLELGS